MRYFFCREIRLNPNAAAGRRKRVHLPYMGKSPFSHGCASSCARRVLLLDVLCVYLPDALRGKVGLSCLAVSHSQLDMQLAPGHSLWSMLDLSCPCELP